MASETLDTSSFENALHLADSLITSVKDWIPLRTQTIHELRNIARELNNIAGTVNTSKVIGRLAAVGGGVMVLGSLFAIALPFAIPLLIAGTATSLIAEGATLGSDFVGEHFSGKKMKKAQKVMDNEKKVLEEIEQIYKELEKKVDEIGIVTNLGKEHVLSAILIANQCGHAHLFGSYGDMGMFFRCVIKLDISEALPVISLCNKFGKMMTITTVKRTAMVATKILGRIMTGAVLVWDIYELISTVVNIHQGCISSAASDLFEIADKYEAQMKKSLAVLSEIEKLSEDFESQLKKKFGKRLVQISTYGGVTDDDVRFLELYTLRGWQQEFNRFVHNTQEYISRLARVFHCLKSKIEKYVDEQNRPKRIRITVIGHGCILSTKTSGSFYYLNDHLDSITLYEPWGSAIDATVVYGIVTDTLLNSKVRYSGNVYINFLGINSEATMIWTWNILPKTMSKEIPLIELSPVTSGELAFQHLTDIINRMCVEQKGYVIPYFKGFSDDPLPFEKIHLSTICHAVGLICAMINIECDMHIACCLTTDTQDSEIISKDRRIVDVEQYYTVSAEVPAVYMTNLAVPAQLSTFIAPMNTFL